MIYFHETRICIEVIMFGILADQVKKTTKIFLLQKHQYFVKNVEQFEFVGLKFRYAKVNRIQKELKVLVIF